MSNFIFSFTNPFPLEFTISFHYFQLFHCLSIIPVYLFIHLPPFFLKTFVIPHVTVTAPSSARSGSSGEWDPDNDPALHIIVSHTQMRIQDLIRVLILYILIEVLTLSFHYELSNIGQIMWVIPGINFYDDKIKKSQSRTLIPEEQPTIFVIWTIVNAGMKRKISKFHSWIQTSKHSCNCNHSHYHSLRPVLTRNPFVDRQCKQINRHPLL